jgi:hypothetical protein
MAAGAVPGNSPRSQASAANPEDTQGKPETRNPKAERNPNSRNPNTPAPERSSLPPAPAFFWLRLSAFFRASVFGLRISLLLALLLL